ncbi:MAG TPA: hypothetical protein VIK74_08970, partial [Parasegetibacter sp.]
IRTHSQPPGIETRSVELTCNKDMLVVLRHKITSFTNIKAGIIRTYVAGRRFNKARRKEDLSHSFYKTVLQRL